MEFPEKTIAKVIDELDNGKANLRVHLVVPSNGDNPWRTQADYEQEQKEARDRHAMFQEQHKIIQRSFYMNILAVTAAVFAALAAIWTAYYTSANKAQVPVSRGLYKKAQERVNFQALSTTTKKLDN